MEIFDDEFGLPGVVTQVEADYTYGYDTSQFGTTDSLIVIGTAFTGPVGDATPIYSPEYARYMFGEPYDSKTHREASLVSGIQDAWDRGCRTIYACRVGGKELYKDFDFRIESDYKLRVRSAFPTNEAKGCYILYDGTVGDEKITLYKPASMATIVEKKRGLVSDKGAVLVTTMKLAADHQLTATSRLGDLIRVFNKNTFNNALVLEIVDEKGNVVTGSKEAASIPVGALYSGAYFIGRDATNPQANIVTENRFQIADGSHIPYVGFEGSYYRTLKKNFDVSLSLPVFAATLKEMRNALAPAGVTIESKQWKFLESADAVDAAFMRNDEDYEEVDLSKFEIYKRLGKGYATTAYAIKRTSNGKELRPRIKESLPSDSRRIVPLEDGIYSSLENAEIRYRALVCANADDKIAGKLPRAEEFLVAATNSVEALGDTLVIKTIVDKKDIRTGIKYKVRFEDLEATDAPIFYEDIEDIYTDEVFQVIGQMGTDDEGKPLEIDAANFKNGDLVINAEGTALFSIVNGAKVELSGEGLVGRRYIVVHGDGSKTIMEYVAAAGDKAAHFESVAPAKNYVLGDVLNHIFVYQKNDNDTLTNIGDLKTMLDQDSDKILVAAENIATGVTNEVVIRSNEFDTMTLAEMVDALNEHTVFNDIFEVELSEEGSYEKDDFVKDPNTKTVAGEHLGEETAPFMDRVVSYDYSLRIPYRTSDNFARQLAQHCTYTELKTTPTFGFIGASHMGNVGLAAVANRAAEMAKADFECYAKNNYGSNMLDRNGDPYPIGKNVNVTIMQYPVNVGGTYEFSSNGAAGYAGYVSTLPLDQSSTGQSYPLNDADFYFTNSQLKSLTNAGFVTLRRSFSKGVVVTDGITMAPAESVYRRLSCSRIVGSIEDLIREAAEPFIGKENHETNRNSLKTAIKSKLDAIIGKLIENYDFVMHADRQLQKLSRIDIDYKIVPIYEIKEIRNTLKITDELTSTTSRVTV